MTVNVHDLPQTGGSYIRDAATGAIRRAEDQPTARPKKPKAKPEEEAT